MKKFYKKVVCSIGLAIAVGFSPSLLLGQGTVQIGSGTTTISNGSAMPITNFDYTYSQQIVTAAEIAAGNGVVGNITKIRYYFSSIGTVTNYNDWTIYLANSARTSFASTTDWEPIASFTQVYTGAITPSASGWYEITLSTPFNYTGGNLIVAVDENVLGWTGAPTFRSYTASAGRAIQKRSDNPSNPDPVTPGTANNLLSNVPQLQFEMMLSPCFTNITGLTTTNVSPTSIDLAWSEGGTELSWNIEWGAPGFTPGTSTYIGTTNVTVNSATISPLTALTTYDVYVQSDCSGTLGPWKKITVTTPQAPVTLPYTDDFSANNWVIVNGTQTNKWFVGSADGNPANSLYISNDVAGATTTYAHSISTVHATKNISFTAGANPFELSFDWKAGGESTYDYMRVWLIPSGATPTAGTQITTSNTPGALQLGAYHNLQATWLRTFYDIPSSYAGTTAKLVFEWRNDGGSGTTTPSIVIDNVLLEENTCPKPTAFSASSVLPTSAEVNWVQGLSETAWNVQWGAPGFTLGSGLGTVNVTDTFANLSPLTENTTYDVYVRAVCTPGDTSSAVKITFTTPQSPVTLPYIDSFNTNNWVLNNGSQVNHWMVGAATGNPANSLYITNDNTANAYTFTSTSTVQATKIITFPAGADNVFNLNFDWLCQGEGTSPYFYDYFRVWLVPTTATITPGTQISTSNAPGAVQIGANFNQQSTWQHASYAIASSNAGTTKKIVFEWKNDFSDGNQPPAAIDNVYLSVIAPPTVVQDGGTPDCVTGASMSSTGTPAANQVWYWQTTATGTDMANNANTPWVVYTNGSYFARAYDTIAAAWSVADTVVITNMPSATTPSAPMAAANPACMATTLSMPAPPTNATYYWQGTNGTSTDMTNDASTPYDVTATGRYYVRSYDSVTQCWSDTISTLVTIGTVTPTDIVTDPNEFFYCTGATTAEISAAAFLQDSSELLTTQAGGNGCGGGNMFNITANTNDVIITGLTITPNLTGAQTVNVYTKVGTYLGSETNSGAWTLLGAYPIATGTDGVPQFLDIDDFTIPGGMLYGIYVNYDADYTTGANTYADAAITIQTGAGLCDNFSSVNANRTFNGRVHYIGSMPANVNWYDAATAGNFVDAGDTIETVGTTVMPTAVAGSYEFYAAATMDGCENPNRALVTVYVDPVNVDLTPVDASCNNGDDGSFVLSGTSCGTAPFTYSVDGGAFGAIPNDLTTGTHTVTVVDANSDTSAVYTITIGSAGRPSDVAIYSLSHDTLTVVWNENGTATQWNVEWGAPGFTPGTSTEIGSATATDTFLVITGLDGATEYDIYVSANCGGATTPGDWGMVNVTTDCAPTAIPYCEGFEDVGALGCWRVVNENNDGDFWQINTSGTYSNSGTNAAQINTDFNAGNNDDYLVMPKITLTGNEVITYHFRARSSFEPNDYEVVLSTTGYNAADFTDVLLSDTVSNTTYQDTSINLSGYTGDVFLAFHIPNGGLDGWYLYIDDVCIDICTPNPGTDGMQDVCRTDSTVNLNPVITSDYNHGTWAFPANPGVVTDSILNVSTLASGTYDVMYVVTTACTSDTTIATINVQAPSSAGNNGLLNVCKNQLIDLYGGLTGNVDFGGTWYNPSNAPMTSSYFQTGTLAGQFVYKYVVSNGECDADTAEVTVNIDNCDYLGLDVNTILDNVTVAPNPNNGTFQIIGIPSADYAYEVLDLNGRLVRNSSEITSSITNVNLTNVENGVYMIRISGNGSEKMIRVIKH